MEGGHNMGTNTLEEQLLLFPEDKNIVLNHNTNTQECKNCKKVFVYSLNTS